MPLVGIAMAIGVVVAAQSLDGGRLRTLLQPTAALVVFGGTLAALVLSFPIQILRDTVAAVRRSLMRPTPPQTLIPRFAEYASRVRRHGLAALEPDLDRITDSFLRRALELAVDGVPAADVKRRLEQSHRACEDRDEQYAQVLESAAGYAPTLGILGAVLGLIHVMENLASPARLGAGIAVAFVATVYGVGIANLIFLPLATRMRGTAQLASLAREIAIEGTASLQQGVHPRVMTNHLDGLVQAAERRTAA